MNEIMKFEHVDFNALVTKNSLDKSLDFRCKIVDELNNTFTEDEKRWCVGNLYMYLNYHQTDEFPIDLENVYKLIGFSNKGNAKSTLVNNFIENVDYKIALMRTQKRSYAKVGKNLAAPYGEARFTTGCENPSSAYTEAGMNDKTSFASAYAEAKIDEENRGGSNKETIMLNVDTFKNLCMLTKTEKAKEIRMYYVKLENMFNKLLKQEMEENKKQLKEKEELLMKQIEECENKDLLLLEQERDAYVKKEKTYFDLFPLNTQCVYFGSIGNRSKTNEKLIKFGITNDLKRRVSEHKRIFIDFKLEHVYRVIYIKYVF
jgi:phage anti-repressor protein